MSKYTKKKVIEVSRNFGIFYTLPVIVYNTYLFRPSPSTIISIYFFSTSLMSKYKRTLKFFTLQLRNFKKNSRTLFNR